MIPIPPSSKISTKSDKKNYLENFLNIIYNYFFFFYQGHHEKILRLCYDLENKILLSAGDDGIVKGWSIDRGENVLTTSQSSQKISSLASGRVQNMHYFFFGDSENKLNVWDLKEKVFLKSLEVRDTIFYLKLVHKENQQKDRALLIFVATHSMGILNCVTFEMIKREQFTNE